METPLVSINIFAFNHEAFISQCIEGVFLQKTSFPYEILIHDDASKDGTADIIRDYVARYPNLIRAVYQTENQYTRGGRLLDRFLMPLSKGKYIAVCDGDDYWVNPYKLQKQIDFLEAHPDYSVCGGMFWVLDEQKKEMSVKKWMVDGMAKFPDGKTVTLDNYLIPYSLLYLTVCFRKERFDVERLKQMEHNNRDDVYYAVLLEHSKGFVFHDYFGVYRLHQAGEWTGYNYEQQHRNAEKYLSSLNQCFGNKSSSIRKMYFITATRLHFIEWKIKKHSVKHLMNMIRFALSGKIKDLFPFQIKFFILTSLNYFYSLLRKREFNP